MPQTLQCYKCGAQNILGMSFCTTCGERFLYKCPQCGANIEPSFGYCSGCSAQLNWDIKTEQTVDNNPDPIQLTKSEQEEKKCDERPKKRGLSLWLIALIIVVLLVAVIFAIDAIF